MNVLIVDDEPLARARIARLLQKLRPDFNIMSLSENAEQALLACSDLVPDLALLDIEMPGLSGIELAEKLKEFNPPPAIIFITAYPDKALPAFAVAPQGYLVKPIDEVALAKAIDGLKISHRAQTALKQQAAIEYIESGIHKSVLVSDVRLVRSEDKYLRVITPNASVLIEGSLKKLLSEFESYFVRVHRNTIVNQSYLTEIGQDHNKHWLKLLDFNEKVEVSRREWPHIKQLIQQ